MVYYPGTRKAKDAMKEMKVIFYFHGLFRQMHDKTQPSPFLTK